MRKLLSIEVMASLDDGVPKKLRDDNASLSSDQVAKAWWCLQSGMTRL